MTRVEGHGKVTILLDEDNRVHQVRLHIVEFRGFEAFIEGRPYWEVPVMVQRLCGICPVSHHLAAAKAMDLIAGYGPLTPTAEKLRRLMHYGQMVQSHALHFFHLASPDLLFGFESEVAKRNIVGVAAAFPDIAKQGVLTRKFGQEVIRHIVGKRIHGTGVHSRRHEQAAAAPLNATRCAPTSTRSSAGAARRSDWSKKLHETQPEFYNSFGESRANMMGLVDERGALDFYHGGLRARDADGGPIFDHVDYATYRFAAAGGDQALELHEVPAYPDARRGQGLVSRRAARARADRRFPATPLAEEERQDVHEPGRGKPQHGALLYHWARMIEMLHAAELARELLDDPDIMGTDLMADKGAAARGGGRRDRGAARHAVPSLPRR